MPLLFIAEAMQHVSREVFLQVEMAPITYLPYYYQLLSTTLKLSHA